MFPAFVVRWSARLALAAGVLAAIAWFSPGRGLPLDDAWIHQVVARTFAETGTLGYAPGQHGAAATSYLWAALLAIDFKLVHVDPTRWALALNALAAVASVELLATLLDRALPAPASTGRTGWRTIAFLAALLGCISPNVLWFVTSGMEAMPFVALSLAAIWASTTERPIAAGFAAGALALLRPEAAPLGGLLATYVFVRRRRSGFGPAIRLVCPWAIAVAIYVGSNLAKTGHAMPSTLAGRRWLWLALSAGSSPLDRAKDFVDAWGTRLGSYTLDTSLGVVWILVALAFYGAIRVMRPLAFADGDDDDAKRRGRDGIRIVVGWSITHAAFYALLLPTPGHGGRYQPFAPLLFATFLPIGAAFVVRDVVRLASGRVVPLVASFGAAAAACAGVGAPVLVSLREANALAVAHIQATEIGAGAFVDTLPEGVVASFDIGGIGFTARRRILDLGGLSDPATAALLESGQTATWLAEHHVRWIVLPQSLEAVLPVFDDYRSRLHLRASRVLSLEPLRVFSTPTDKWQPAITATWNAAQTQVVYDVTYAADPKPSGGTRAAPGARRQVADAGGLCHRRERDLAEHMLATLAASGLTADVALTATPVDAGPRGPAGGCRLRLGWWGFAVDGCDALGPEGLRASAYEKAGRYLDVGDLGGALTAIPYVLAEAKRRVDPSFDPPLAPLSFPTPGGNAPSAKGASGSASLVFFGALLACGILALAASLRDGLVRRARALTRRGAPALRVPAVQIILFFALLAPVLRWVVGATQSESVGRAVRHGRGAVELALANAGANDPARYRDVLFDAAAAGDPEIVALLLARGVPADTRGPDGTTPLHVAARHGHHAAVTLLAARDESEKLLDAPSGVRARTPLADAVKVGATDSVAALLHAGAAPSKADAFGQTPLHLLATVDHARARPIAKRLLDAGADAAAVDARGFTPLHAAATNDDVELVDALLEGTRENREALLSRKTPLGENALAIALRYHKDRAAEALLRAGATPADDGPWPPLHDAARMDAVDRASALLAMPADISRLFHDMTALGVAHARGSKRVEALLAAAQVPTPAPRSTKATPETPPPEAPQ